MTGLRKTATIQVATELSRRQSHFCVEMPSLPVLVNSDAAKLGVASGRGFGQPQELEATPTNFWPTWSQERGTLGEEEYALFGGVLCLVNATMRCAGGPNFQ